MNDETSRRTTRHASAAGPLRHAPPRRPARGETGAPAFSGEDRAFIEAERCSSSPPPTETGARLLYKGGRPARPRDRRSGARVPELRRQRMFRSLGNLLVNPRWRCCSSTRGSDTSPARTRQRRRYQPTSRISRAKPPNFPSRTARSSDASPNSSKRGPATEVEHGGVCSLDPQGNAGSGAAPSRSRNPGEDRARQWPRGCLRRDRKARRTATIYSPRRTARRLLPRAFTGILITTERPLSQQRYTARTNLATIISATRPASMTSQPRRAQFRPSSGAELQEAEAERSLPTSSCRDGCSTGIATDRIGPTRISRIPSVPISSRCVPH